MTKRPTVRVCVDSDVIVNVLAGGREDGGAERYPHGFRLLDAHDRGDIEIVLSAITPAEVMGNHRLRGTAEANRWLTTGGFVIVEIDSTAIRDAAAGSARHDIKGADALVLGAAIETGCAVLYTWDRGLRKIGRTDGVTIATPEAFVSPNEDLFANVD